MEIEEIEEIFKPIEGYPKYEISNLGRCRNIRHKKFLKDRMIHEYVTYYLAGLDDSGNIVRKNVPKHVILAKLFLENPNNFPMVDHIDRNPSNNSLENLRWVTASQNNRNISVNNPHGHRGITYRKDKGLYVAQIAIDKKKIHIASNKDKNVVIEAYKKFIVERNLADFIDLSNYN